VKVKEFLEIFKDTEFESVTNRRNIISRKFSGFGYMHYEDDLQWICFDVINGDCIVTEQYSSLINIPEDIMEATVLKVNKLLLKVDEHTSMYKNEYVRDYSNILLTIKKENQEG
jgi:hypothetical protein